jgi:hypothetical protein
VLDHIKVVTALAEDAAPATIAAAIARRNSIENLHEICTANNGLEPQMLPEVQIFKV